MSVFPSLLRPPLSLISGSLLLCVSSRQVLSLVRARRRWRAVHPDNSERQIFGEGRSGGRSVSSLFLLPASLPPPLPSIKLTFLLPVTALYYLPSRIFTVTTSCIEISSLRTSCTPQRRRTRSWCWRTSECELSCPSFLPEFFPSSWRAPADQVYFIDQCQTSREP